MDRPLSYCSMTSAQANETNSVLSEASPSTGNTLMREHVRLLTIHPISSQATFHRQYPHV
jgi:hypothetical protein